MKFLVDTDLPRKFLQGTFAALAKTFKVMLGKFIESADYSINLYMETKELNPQYIKAR